MSAGGKMTESEIILKLKDINKSFQNYKVFQGLNLEIKRGEISCLLGPSGSGKTTLFRIAAGLEKADGGEVIKNNSPRFAYVFQTPRLLPWKTAEENLIFVQKNYNLKYRDELRKLLFELAGLKDFKNSYPHELSGGMQQRLEFIRAFAIKPDLVFLDEPFKSLDMKTKVNLRKLLSVIQKETGKTIFLITHDPEEALLLADSINILDTGGGNIVEKFKIEKSREKRKISDPDLYQKFEKIMDVFNVLVSDFDYSAEKMKKLF